LGFEVESFGLQVAVSNFGRVARWQGVRVAACQDDRVAGWQEVWMTGWQGVRVAACQDDRVAGSQDLGLGLAAIRDSGGRVRVFGVWSSVFRILKALGLQV
jgi:hypothetical protein